MIVKSDKYWSKNRKMWETKYIICWFLPVYILSLRQSNKYKYRFSFVSSKNKLTGPIITHRYISQQEIDEEYQGNKWLVPVNYKFDETVK